MELESVKTDLDEQLKESNKTREELDQRVIELREKYYHQHKEKFKLLYDLCTAYYVATYKEKKDRIYEQVKDVVSQLSSENGQNLGVEDLANNYLDNIIINLRKDVPGQKDSQYQLFAYLVVGISPKSISALMNTSVSAIYTRIHRLKESILAIEPKNQERYLPFL